MKSRRRDVLKWLLNGIAPTPTPLRWNRSDIDIAHPRQPASLELHQLIEAHKRACKNLDGAYPQADLCISVTSLDSRASWQSSKTHFRMAFYSFPVTSLEEVESKAYYVIMLLEQLVDGTEIEELLILFRSFTPDAFTSEITLPPDTLRERS
jgi:hypothetical protein